MSRMAPMRIALGVALATVGFPIRPAFAQAVDPSLWVANGPVYAVARSGNTLYLGGNFTQLGPASGAGVPIDAATGAPAAGFPKVAGIVRAVAPDGAGGWFIAGTFAAVGGIPNGSRSPCTTSTGTVTASSSSRRLAALARPGARSGNARQSTARAPVASEVRQATRAPKDRPPTRSGKPRSSPASR